MRFATRVLWILVFMFSVSDSLWAQESAYEFGLAYKGDWVTNLKGGLERKSGYLGNLDITLDIDLEKVVKAKGLSLSLYGLGNHGDDPTEFIGDSFATSNIEAPNTFKLYEAYLKQNFSENIFVLLGLRDLNADFYTLEAGGVLINSAFGISPSLSQTGVQGPSIFPQAALALVARVQSEKGYFLQAGVFNAQAGELDRPYGTHVHFKHDHGHLVIVEAGLGESDPIETGPNRVTLGYWGYTQSEETLDGPGEKESNFGSYALIQNAITKTTSTFLKYGLASELINTFHYALEVGLLSQGVFSSRPEDFFTFGYAQVRGSEKYEDLNDSADTEQVFEIAYRVKLQDHVYLTPDLQFIKNPGLSNEISDAQVGTLRIELEL